MDLAVAESSLFEKYRPKDFNSLVGEYSHLANLNSHSILITGSSGTGKTTIAKLLGKKFGSDNPYYINVGNNTSVDDIRELLERTLYMPIDGSATVIILDEVHKASSSYFDALLIPLENPPKHVYWILCTTEANKIPDTIISRCKQIATKSINDVDMLSLLDAIAHKEATLVSNQVLSKIVEISDGNARTAINHLEMVLPLDKESGLDYLSTIDLGMDAKEFIEIARAYWKKENWSAFVEMLKPYKKSNSIESIRIVILGYGVSILSKKHDANLVKSCNYLRETTYDNGYNDLIVILAKGWG